MFDKLLSKFEPIHGQFISSAPIQRVLTREMTVPEFRAVLREIFHHTRENPQLQTLATVKMRGRQRDMVRNFFAHAASEIGHDQLALNDFQTLGGDPTNIPYENPLPATSALLAYGFYQIYNLNPLGYLGYLFFLEFTPTRSGSGLMDALRDVGVPDSAMTFLKDHTEIDQAHNKMMQKYVERLILNDQQLDCVVYSMQTTCELYLQMVSTAVDSATNPVDTGWNWEELNADNLSPAMLSKMKKSA